METAATPLLLDDAAQVQAMLALHDVVFSSAADRAWFDWKYGAGQGCGTGLWSAGEMVAYCGGVPRTLWHQGECVHGLQVGDVMVHPMWRGVLSRRGPFQRVSSAFYERVLGAASSGKPFALGFGFPSHRHLAVAQRLSLLHDAGPMWGLHWACGEAGNWVDGSCLLDARWRVTMVDAASPGFDDLLDSAWRSMQASAAAWVVGERSATWVRWRMLKRPARPVQFAAVHEAVGAGSGGSLVGIAALDGLAHQPPMWLDWIGSPALIGLGLRAARLVAARGGHSALQAWVSPAVKAQLEEARAGFAQPLAVAEVARIGVPCASAWPLGEPAAQPWWFMAADTDFL